MMTSHFRWLAAFFALLFYSHLVFAGINSTDTPSRLTISNARLTVSLNKSIGAIDFLSLDGQDLLGQSLSEEPRPGGPTGNGISGVGPYLDCYCVKEGSGSYTPGSHNATIKLIQGTEGGGVGGKVFAGFSMRDVNPRSGQIMEFYAFLRENETGLHTFSRLAYPSNKTGPTRNVLQEFRTMFRPNSPLWTHIVANNQTIAPLPMRKHLKAARFVQDATYDLTAYRDDPYVQQTSNYFTKYSFSDTFKDHEAHGLYADGTGGGQGYRNVTWFGKNDTWGAWLVTWNKETYYGGPLRSDLTVDGIVYDYMVSNHYGANVPNITVGFDRTFGPNYYYFNHKPPKTPISTLYDEARAYVPPSSFLNSVARYVPNYVAPANRTTLRAATALPRGAKNAILILSASGMDVQDNAASPTTAQYWTKVPTHGGVTLRGVIPGTYRITMYADGVFGSYTKDNVTVTLGRSSPFPVPVAWSDDPSAYEVWRIGNPDHSAGEYRHGYSKDTRHKLGLQEYRVFHGAYNFWRDFPDGVVYRIGTSTPERDWNYVHWSGGNSTWTIVWDMATVSPQAPLADPVAAPEGQPGQPFEDSVPPSAGPIGGVAPPGNSPTGFAGFSGADKPSLPLGAPSSPSGGIDPNPARNSPGSPFAFSWSAPKVPPRAPPTLPIAGGKGTGSDVASSWLRLVSTPTASPSLVPKPTYLAVDSVLSREESAKELYQNHIGDEDRIDSSSRKMKRRHKRQDTDDKVATLTIQAAGVRTAAGNEHVFAPGLNMSNNKYANLDVTAALNGQSIGVWTIPYYHSSSCAVRSGVTCYNTAHKFTFDAELIRPAGIDNVLTLSLPPGARGSWGHAKLTNQLYIQYDALRLEIQSDVSGNH